MRNQLLEDVAALVAEVAATVVLPRWRNLAAGDIAQKTGPDDIVTVADKAAEVALSARLLALLPGSAVIGEEAVSADPAVLGRFASTGPIWVIDPIDGTSAFAAGASEFAVMVALVENGRPAAGWILAPALGLMTYGSQAGGAFQSRDGGAVTLLAAPEVPPRIGDMVGLLGRRNITEGRRAELAAKEPYFKALDGVACAGIDYPRIVRGEAHFALYNKSEPWDHLPGLGILAAHGVHAAKFDGSPYRPGDNTGGLLVAPNAAAFADIRQALLG